MLNNNIKGAIFDVDGTLIDSMQLWHKIDIEFLKKREMEVPEDLKDNIDNLTFLETAKYFKSRFNLEDTTQSIMDEWNNMALYEYSNNIGLKKGVKIFLDFLKSNNVKMSIATTNCEMLVNAVLKNNNIINYFEEITTTSEVKRGKNFPDIYLLSAKKLNLKPQNCIVFEDILPAVIGAKKAGMTVIGVHDCYSEYQKNDIIKYADKYIYDFEELI